MAAASVRPMPLRAACLRGIALEANGPLAVVALSAEQFLLLPLPADDLPRWRARVGRRVWVNLNDEPMRLRADPADESRHA